MDSEIIEPRLEMELNIAEHMDKGRPVLESKKISLIV